MVVSFIEFGVVDVRETTRARAEKVTLSYLIETFFQNCSQLFSRRETSQNARAIRIRGTKSKRTRIMLRAASPVRTITSALLKHKLSSSPTKASTAAAAAASSSLNKRAMFNRSVLLTRAAQSSSSTTAKTTEPRVENVEKHESFMTKTLFVELGVGSDQHGQNGTKAAVRACKDAISFNSLPAIADLIPGGYGGMKLHVLVAAPIDEYPVDVDEVKQVFPYGKVHVELVQGGMVASSGIAIEAMGDGFEEGKANDDFIVVNAAVSVGY